MATVTKPIALDESLNTTEQTPRNVADVLAQELARIAGRQASDVNYDNTDSGLTADNVQNAIDELKSDIPTVNDGTLTIQQNGETKGTFTANQSGNSTVNIETPTPDIQTAVDEFETYNGGLLSECIVELVPVQSGSGDPSPDNVRPISGHTQVDVGDDGKNLFDWTNRPSFVGFIDTNSQTFRLNPNYICTYITCKPNTTYTISKEAGKTFRIATSAQIPADGVSYIGTSANHTGTSITYTTESNAKYLVVLYWSSTNGDAKTADELAQTIQIELGSTATPYVPYNGYQVTVNLGGTYYSGTLDVVSGELTVDSAFIASYNGETLPSTWISDRDVYAVGTTPTTGAEVCYKLATPLTIQLSPTMVKALVGENHLSAPLEGQEITESKYKQAFTFDDVNAQIESTYSEGISHNSVYRGKYLGDHVTDEQWDAIGDGSFRDLYIGDYWAINGINWRIAHFNYWLGTGDVKCNTNHVVIVPYGWVSTFNMNASDDTTGGYLNSEWYTTNRHFAVENIEADFGASHILSHRNFFSDAVSDGHASHGMWVDSTVDLMNEIMVCGSLVGSYSGKYYEVGCDKFQLALFKYNPPSARMDVSYWLRGVSTASSFVAMGNFGLLDGFTASQILKIRPVFAIKK